MNTSAARADVTERILTPGTRCYAAQLADLRDRLVAGCVPVASSLYDFAMELAKKLDNEALRSEIAAPGAAETFYKNRAMELEARFLSPKSSDDKSQPLEFARIMQGLTFLQRHSHDEDARTVYDYINALRDKIADLTQKLAAPSAIGAPSIDDAIAACEAVWRAEPPLTSGMLLGVERCIESLRALKVAA